MSKRNGKGARRGHVRLGRDGKWMFVLSAGTDPETGKRVRIWRYGYPSKGAAETGLTELLGDKDSGRLVTPSTLTVGEWLSSWIEGRGKIGDSTRAWYSSLIQTHITPAIGQVKLQDLTADDLVNLYSSLTRRGSKRRPKGLSPRTVRAVHTTMHRALSDAARRRRVVRNVAEGASEELPGTSKTEVETWSADELRSFLRSTSSDRYGPLYAFASMTGARRGEVLGVRRRDLDLDAARVSIRQTYRKDGDGVGFGPTKSKRARVIDLDAETVTVLRAHLKTQASERLALGLGKPGADDLIFTVVEGDPIHPDSLSGMFRRAVKAAGVRALTFHGLRHTHATLLLEAGVHPKVVQERLGHASIAITMDLYSHVTPTMQADAARAVGGLVFGG